jgi:ATP-dependent Clp protease ATP-binding subunit ClpA
MPEQSLYEEQWTPRLRRSVDEALNMMNRFPRNGLDSMLLLAGLFSLGGGIPWNVLNNAGITLELLERELAQGRPIEEQFQWKGVMVSDSVKRVFSCAREYALKIRHTYIGTDHLFLAILDEIDSPATEFLARHLDREKTRAAVLKELTGE